MPEAFAVLAVFVVVVVAWVGALIQSRDPAQHDPVAEVSRLRQQQAWLEQRLAVARRENWSGDMVTSLDDELDATSRALAKADTARG